MTVVNSVVANPARVPVHGATVTVQLVSSGHLPGFGVGETIVGVFHKVTGPDGAWSVDLTPNDEILPANTHYRVTEQVGPAVSTVYTILVPATGGPYSVRDVLATDPATPSPLVPAGAVAWADITGKPASFPPSAHTHAQADVTGLGAALAGKSDAGHAHGGVYVPVTAVGAADGVASLGPDGKVPAGQLPSSSGGGPRPGEYPLEDGYGLVAATGDPLHFMQSSGFNSIAFFTRIWVPAGKAMTGLWVAVRSAASGHDGISTGNRLGLYTDAGVLVDQTPSDATLWTAQGWRGGNLAGGPVAAQGAGRFVYVAAIANGYSSGASVSFATGAADSLSVQRGPGSAGNRRSFFNGGAALPANFDPTVFGTASGFIPLYGIS